MGPQGHVAKYAGKGSENNGCLTAAAPKIVIGIEVVECRICETVTVEISPMTSMR